MARGGRRSTTSSRSTTSGSSSSARSSSRSRCRPSGQYTYYPGTTEVPEASAAKTHDVSYKILAEVEFTPTREGVIVRPGLALRRLLAVRQGRQAHLRLQLPRHPARAAGRRRRADVRHAHRRRRVHQGARRRAPRVARPAQALHRRRGRRRGADPHDRRRATACAARACASATTAATPSAARTSRQFASPAARS